MAYEARRSEDSLDEQLQEQRNTTNNANNVRNASSVAMASGVPHAMAVGAAVKAADKVTGGKSSEAIGKALNQANKMTPLGNQNQNLSIHNISYHLQLVTICNQLVNHELLLCLSSYMTVYKSMTLHLISLTIGHHQDRQSLTSPPVHCFPVPMP